MYLDSYIVLSRLSVGASFMDFADNRIYSCFPSYFLDNNNSLYILLPFVTATLCLTPHTRFLLISYKTRQKSAYVSCLSVSSPDSCSRTTKQAWEQVSLLLPVDEMNTWSESITFPCSRLSILPDSHYCLASAH